MDYAEKLQSPRWQKKRLQILKRDKWRCRYCNDTETLLHVHHLKYTTKQPYDEDSKNLITCCKDCHRMLEYFKTNFCVLGLIKIKCDEGITYLVMDSDFKVHIQLIPPNPNYGIVNLGNTSNMDLDFLIHNDE